ncbi:MAG: mono/diheme cytochrome c family protein [Kiritimatiellia bacterium]|jgi:mono/diheme cytochrome c family protein
MRFNIMMGLLLVGTFAGAGAGRAEEAVLAPQAYRILATHCFECHGPDEGSRKAKLRLDTREGALAHRKGDAAIVPGAPSQSTVMIRVRSTDPDERMPPPENHKALTPYDLSVLEQWIQAGAPYEAHWAFVPPVRPALPESQLAPIDALVFARLAREGIAPSPHADKYTLVRRVYLDLIGLPPTPEEADAFVNDEAADAYARLVDRLLALPQYGERWARRWLDLARYADTNGYEKDRERSIWPYRDWVIQALNDDMPYDQFSIEQLAGDMLPEATVAQRVATGFHRNTMLNEEGGIDPLEYRFYAMVDRVATTGTIWMGLTVGCAQCHTHKYDPLAHSDYYNLMALLNNADEPDFAVTDAAFEQRLQAYEERLSVEEAQQLKSVDPDAFAAWVSAESEKAANWNNLKPVNMTSTLPHLDLEDEGVIFASGDFTKREMYTLGFDFTQQPMTVKSIRLEALPDERLPAGGPGRAYYEGRKGDFFLSEMTLRDAKGDFSFQAGSASYGKISVGNGQAKAENLFDGDGSTGWSTSGGEGQAHQVVLQLAEPRLLDGPIELELLFERHFVAGLGKFRVSACEVDAEAKSWSAEVESLLALGEPTEALKRAYLFHGDDRKEARKPLEALLKKRPGATQTMVMQERASELPRPTFRHHRGEYLSPQEAAVPAVPRIFPGLEGDADRLSFARWLVSERNPLAARVAVNRAWQAFFGRGLVPTLDDFGVQASPPLQADLLDWLACELVEQGWSLKTLHRQMVLSAVYQQASHHRVDLVDRDPYNDLLARGPRFRVDAEMLRDVMLTSCGVLTRKIGGPSVRPPQPASVMAMAYGGGAWAAAKGDDRYRRSLYTFSKRTAPFAAYAAFDAPSGEACIALRDRSNTPLQALTLFNDDMFVELARALGKEAAAQSDPGRFVFRRLLTRPPEPAEIERIQAFYVAQLARLNAGELDAKTLCKNDQATDVWAAWTLVVRAIMNLDETITKS